MVQQSEAQYDLTTLRQELQFLLIYSTSPKIYYFQDISAFNNMQVPYLVFLPRVTQPMELVFIQNKAGFAQQFPQLRIVQTTPINYKFELNPEYFQAHFQPYQDIYVNSGLYQCIQFINQLTRLNEEKVMERAYLRDYFIASLDAFPVEVWLSESVSQLVEDIGQTLLVNVRGLGAGEAQT